MREEGTDFEGAGGNGSAVKIEDVLNKVHCFGAMPFLKSLPNESIDCAITSPPYWALRDYGIDGQFGLEATAQEYVNKLCNIFDEVKRVLKPVGTCWVNLGDTYGGTGDKGNWRDPKYPDGRNGQSRAMNKSAPAKSLCQIPSRFAIEMTDRGWILRNEIIWHKKNAMPSSVSDRFTVDYEKVFFFVKEKKYWFEQQIEPNQTKYTKSWGNFKRNKVVGQMADIKMDREDFDKYRTRGRNKRCVWDVMTKPFRQAHFAVFPEALVEPMIRAGCPVNGIVMDIFAGSGTTGVVAKKLGRNFIGVDLNPAYCDMARKRIGEAVSVLNEGESKR